MFVIDFIEVLVRGHSSEKPCSTYFVIKNVKDCKKVYNFLLDFLNKEKEKKI